MIPVIPLDSLFPPAVLPILPSVSGLLTVFATFAVTFVVALVTLRRRAWSVALRLLWSQKWGLLVLAMLVVGAVQVAALVRPQESDRRLPDVWPSGHWPMYRGTPSRTGHVDELAGPSSGGVQWTGGRGFEFMSSPAIVGDLVLAVGTRRNSSRVFAWNAETGVQSIMVALDDYRATFSSPVVADGLLVLGEGLHTTPNSRVFCLDFDRSLAIQQFVTASHVECTPVIDENRIYVNAGNDGIYCLSAEPGSLNLRVVWHAPGELYPDAETALAVHGDYVYVGLGHGGQALCQLDKESGREIRRREMPWPVFSPPAVRDARIYVGLGRADYVAEEHSPGALQCLDLNSLEEIWSYPTSAAVMAAIAVDETGVVFSSVDGQLFCLDHNGNEQNRWRTGTRLLTAPAVTRDMIYVIANDGILRGLDRHSLETLWSIRAGDAGRYISSPIVAKGRIYVGTPDGFVCAGEPAPVGNHDLWPSRWGGTDQSRRPIARLPDRVDVAWTLAGPVDAERADVTAPPAVVGDDLLVPMASADWFGLVCVDANSRDQPLIRWTLKTAAPIHVSPVISGECVLCASGPRGAAGELIAVDRMTGDALWRKPVASVSDTLTVDSQSLTLSDNADHLTRYTLSGEQVWRVTVGRVEHPPTVHGPLVVASVASPPRLIAVDALTGQALWSAELEQPSVDSAVIVGQRIVVPTKAGIEVRLLIDGSLESIADERSPMTGLSIDSDRIVMTTADGELVVYATFNAGQPMFTTPAQQDVPPAIAANGIVYAANLQQLMWRSFDEDDPPRLWFDAAEFGEVVSPPVFHSGRAFLPVSGAGLLCLESHRP